MKTSDSKRFIPKLLMILSLILAAAIFGSTCGMANRDALEKEQWNAEQDQLRENFINTLRTLFAELYPDGEFVQDPYQPILHSVNLYGFTYDNQPDFDYERERLMLLKQNPIFIDRGYDFSVDFYFEGADLPFVSFHFRSMDNNDDWHFNAGGMTEDAFNQVIEKMNEYIADRYSDYSISIKDGSMIVVAVNEVIDREEEPNEAEFWQNFMEMNDINRDLVQITVLFHMPDERLLARALNVDRSKVCNWIDSYLSYYE